MADREAVMLGTLTETQPDGHYEEQAMVSEGKHNTLVTMVRQLLIPYLEKIDSDTEDITAKIPL